MALPERSICGPFKSPGPRSINPKSRAIPTPSPFFPTDLALSRLGRELKDSLRTSRVNRQADTPALPHSLPACPSRKCGGVERNKMA